MRDALGLGGGQYAVFFLKKKPRHSNNYYEVSATNSMLVSFNFNFCFTSCAYKSLNAPLFVSISFPKSVSKLVIK